MARRGGRRTRPRGAGHVARRRRSRSTAEISLEEAFHGTQPDRRARRPPARGHHPARRRHRQPDPAHAARARTAATWSSSSSQGRTRVVHAPGRRPRARGAGHARARRSSGARSRSRTLKGRVLLKVPPGTQNGRTFRLKGQGMPRFKGDGDGRPVRPDPRRPADRPVRRGEGRGRGASLDLVDQPDPRA